MGATNIRTDAPLLVVVRAIDEVAGRTIEAVEAARRRTDRFVVARPDGAAAGAIRTSAGRRVNHEDVVLADVLTLAAQHGRSTGGATVLVDNGAFGFGHRWLSDLADALGPCAVVTASTNGAPWPNCPPDLPDHRATRTAWRDFARSVSSRPVVVPPDPMELGGPAVALSARAAIELATSLAPGTDPSAAAVVSGARRRGLAVGQAAGVYVHDERASVLLSACLIVRDEIDNLARCLGSLGPVVDEIVVYDTGSTDGSQALARSLGAVVVPGHWDDDFSRARNAAREACRGTWLLHIDADEEIEAPLGARDVRAVLERDIPVDLLAVPLFNMAGTELAPVRAVTPHWVPRILHRARCHWTGALHEHPMPVHGRGDPRTVRNEQLSLLHYGYLDEVLARRNKSDRNARIADTKLDEAGETGRTHFDRARTHVMNGRNDEAVAEYALAADAASNPIHRRCSMEHAALVLINTGRPDEADPWIARREAIADSPGVGRWLRARQALVRGRPADALVALDGITDYTDNFSTNGPDGLHLMRAEASIGLGRFGDAADELVSALGCNPVYDQAWLHLIGHAARWPEVFTRVASLVPAEQLKLLAGKLLSVPAATAALIVEALWAAHPGAPALLALATELAPRLELEPAATWSVRLRAAGLTQHCPLRAIAADPARPTVTRLQAAYLGAELFDDADLRARVADLSALLPT